MREERESEERPRLLPDYLASGLDVIFVGAAPSHTSANIGHWYAGKRNRFYTLLYQAGFTPRLFQPEEDGDLLQFGIGLTCINPYQSTRANHLLPAPTPERRAALRAKLLACAPRFICYNGKDVYRMCTEIPDCPWGLQPEPLGVSQQFVVYSTSGRADHWGADRLALFQELKARLDAAKR